MCGRFALKKFHEELADLLEVEKLPEIPARYNIAPGQPIFAVRESIRTGNPELVLLHWGLIPSWAKDPAIGYKMINARSETAAEKPSFRSALKRRRCLVPADAFYEWSKQGKAKQPFAISMKDRRPFVMGGIWEHWIGPNGEEMESVSILTTSANEVLKPLHDRMPVIISKSARGVWLDCKDEKADSYRGLMVPYPSDQMEAWPVSTLVNSPRNDSPECLEQVREMPASAGDSDDLLGPLK